MTTRWLLLSLLTLLAVPLTEVDAQQTADRSEPKSEETRSPGRFLRKLREDFTGRKEEDDKAKDKLEAPRTPPRGESSSRGGLPDRDTGGFSSLFSPPAFLGGQSASRLAQQEDPKAATASQSRPTFKFSQPTLPPPVAETLPRPAATSGQRSPGQLPPPPRASATKPLSSRQNSQLSKPGSRPEIGQPEPAPKSRQLDFASTPTRKQPKPSINEGFGFELVDREGGVFIDKIKSKGNAEQADLKKGDRIAKIGGVEVELIQQFEEIAEMLESGDQIEIVISRRGKDEEVNLQFGKPPADPETPTENSQPSQPAVRLSEPGEIPDFAPPAGESSRYEPGVTELPEENSVSNGSESSNGFRSPSLPETSDSSSGYAAAEYQRIIYQQQEQIRQLQVQVQQLRQQLIKNQQPAPSNQRGRR